MPYDIRSAGEKDILPIYNFICILEETIFNYAAFELIFKANIYNENYYYLAAESDSGNIIGFISCHVQSLLHHCGKVAEIQELFVEEKHRKYGIGRQFIYYLEKKLQQQECVLLEVSAQNKRLQTHLFYERLGFECTHKKFVKQLV